MFFIGTLRFMFHYCWIPFLSILFFLAPVFSETKPVGFAILFPELTFQQILSKEERAYLGIPRKTNFSFKEIRGSLIFVEFMSTYCVGCQSVTIIYKEGMVADALATAVFVLGPEKGYGLCQKLQAVDCLIVDKEGKIIFSPGLKDLISFTP